MDQNVGKESSTQPGSTPKSGLGSEDAIGAGVAAAEGIPPGKALNLTVSRDKMEAYVVCDMRIDIGDPEKALKEMAAFLEANKIKNIKMDVLQTIVDNAPVAGSLLVSEGKPPIDGQDGHVMLEIERQDNADEREKSLERVDFRAMRHIDNVSPGTVLARLSPATKGEDGYDVTGKTLKAKPGKPARLMAGKNVEIAPDGMVAKATCDGVARVVVGRLTVEPVFKVNGDVDYVVGNIDFVGDVEVSGDVFLDFIIRAKGSIRVRGNVDKSTLTADLDVSIQGGLFGGPDAKIGAGHDVTVNFAENAIIEATNDVIATDSLMNCDVRAGNMIILPGSKLCCVGGRIVASGGIEAINLGTPRAPVRTIAQIQVDPRLKRLRARWLAALEKEENPRTAAVLKAKLATAERQIERQQRAGIVVKDRLYPGVEIIIDDVRYRPSSELTHVRFCLSTDEHKILMIDL